MPSILVSSRKHIYDRNNLCCWSLVWRFYSFVLSPFLLSSPNRLFVQRENASERKKTSTKGNTFSLRFFLSFLPCQKVARQDRGIIKPRMMRLYREEYTHYKHIFLLLFLLIFKSFTFLFFYFYFCTFYSTWSKLIVVGL